MCVRVADPIGACARCCSLPSVLTASYDGSAKFLNAYTGECTQTLSSHAFERCYGTSMLSSVCLCRDALTAGSRCSWPWLSVLQAFWGCLEYLLCRLLKVLFVLKLKFVLLGKMPLSIRLFVLMVRPAVAVRPEVAVRSPRQVVALLVSRPAWIRFCLSLRDLASSLMVCA